MENSTHFNETISIASPKELINLNLFWTGFIIYTVINCVNITEVLNNILIYQLIQIISFILMISGALNLIRFRFDNSYLLFIYILYSIWLIYLLLKGMKYNIDFFKLFFLQGPYRAPLYFAPIILLFPRNITFYKKLFSSIISLGIFFAILNLVFIKLVMNPDRSSTLSQAIVEFFSTLSVPCGFILLTQSYHSKRRKIIAIGVFILGFLVAVYRARRGLDLNYALMILFSYLLFMSSSKMKLFIIYISIFIALLGAAYIGSLYKPLENRLFGFLAARGDQDTREMVEDYFHSDMKTNDWIFGRGVTGEYFCPGVEEGQDYRESIETGYEQIILNGGLISLGLFLLIAIPGMIKGLFYSRNILSKAAGIWILLSLINLYPATVDGFTLQFLLVWVSIGICYSDRIRKMPEINLKELFTT